MSTRSKPSAPAGDSTKQSSDGPDQRPVWLVPALGAVVVAHLLCLGQAVNAHLPASVWLVLLHAIVPIAAIAAGVIAYASYDSGVQDPGAVAVWAVIVGLTGAPIVYFTLDTGAWIPALAGAWFAIAVLLKPPLEFTGQKLAILACVIGIFVGLMTIAERGYQNALVEAKLQKQREIWLARFNELLNKRKGWESRPGDYSRSAIYSLKQKFEELGPPPPGTEPPKMEPWR